jgi:hypothetical protein
VRPWDVGPTTHVAAGTVRDMPSLDPAAARRLNDIGWLRRRYVDEGATVREIAVQVGCGHASVAVALRRHGIPVRTRGRRLGHPLLDDRDWLRRRYVVEGARQSDIAADLDLSRRPSVMLCNVAGSSRTTPSLRAAYPSCAFVMATKVGSPRLLGRVLITSLCLNHKASGGEDTAGGRFFPWGSKRSKSAEDVSPPPEPDEPNVAAPSGWWKATLEIASAVGGLLGFYLLLVGQATELWVTILVIWLCVLSFGLFVALFVLERRYRSLMQRIRTKYYRRAAFAEAARSLRKAHKALRDATYNFHEGQPHMEDYLRSLDCMQTAYTVIAGAECRVSVKELRHLDDPTEGQFYVQQFYVQTFGRSRNSQAPNRAPEDEPAPVISNTDFLTLFEDAGKTWFACNDLTQLPNYTNSNWDANTVAEQRYDYVATLVWPIRKDYTDENAVTQHDLVGYLCVDTLKADAFDKGTDFSFGAAFADTLYTFLALLRRDDPDRSRIEAA